jgi:hypothetical protein
VEAILNWPTPENVADVRSFLGLCGFYHKFIQNFAQLTLPISELMKKNKKFTWSTECEAAFQSIKQAFDKATTLYTDASDKALGATLNQLDSKDNLKLLACFSKKLGQAKLNYGAHEKELLALMQALTYWLRRFSPGRW